MLVEGKTMNDTSGALEEAQRPPVGSVSVLASEESDRATGKTNTFLGTLNHVGRQESVSIGVDDDLGDFEGTGCVLGDTECESCQ